MKVNVIGLRKVSGTTKAGQAYKAVDLFYTYQNPDCDGVMTGNKRLYDNIMDKFPVAHMIKVNDVVNLDFDNGGYLVGLEIVPVSSPAPAAPIPPKSGFLK